jgi:sulfofructose kinase
MSKILLAGVAVMDFVLSLDNFPANAQKYRARDAMVVGGGCAANAAVAVSRLGGHALFAARLGEDPIGDMIVSGLQDDGVDCALVKQFPGRRSSFSSVIVDAAGERQIVNFRDEDLSFDAGWLREQIPHDFNAALGDTRWPQGAAALMVAAKVLSRPGVIDAEAPFDKCDAAMQSASHIAFSSQGLREFTGILNLEDGLRKAGETFASFVCVTNGAENVLYLDRGEIRSIPSFDVGVVDTLGAGDAWHGAFTLALGEGKKEQEAIRFANAAAAIKCTRFGGRAGIPDRATVEKFLKEMT